MKKYLVIVLLCAQSAVIMGMENKTFLMPGAAGAVKRMSAERKDDRRKSDENKSSTSSMSFDRSSSIPIKKNGTQVSPDFSPCLLWGGHTRLESPEFSPRGE